MTGGSKWFSLPVYPIGRNPYLVGVLFTAQCRFLPSSRDPVIRIPPYPILQFSWLTLMKMCLFFLARDEMHATAINLLRLLKEVRLENRSTHSDTRVIVP